MQKRSKSHYAFHWSDIKSVFYHQLLMVNIVSPDCPVGTRVRAHGWITQLRMHDKLLAMVVTDLTETIECILFKATLTGVDGDHDIKAGHFIRFMGFKQQQTFRNEHIHKIVVRRYEVIDDADQQLKIAMKFLQTNRQCLRTLKKMSDVKNFFEPNMKTVVLWKKKEVAQQLTINNVKTMIVRYLYDSFADNPDCKKLVICTSIIMKNPLIKSIFQKKKIDYPKAQDMVENAMQQMVKHRLLEPHKQKFYMAYELAFKNLEQMAMNAIQSKNEKGANAGQIFDHIEQKLFQDVSSVTSADRSQNQYGLDLVYTILKRMQNNRKIFRNADGYVFKLS